MVETFNSLVFSRTLVSLTTLGYVVTMWCFNPRPRVEGDARSSGRLRRPKSFNPRPRVEGDTCTYGMPSTISGFNPRPRVEGDGSGGTVQARAHVSIRALAWRATAARLTRLVFSICFNPRPRVEGDSGAAWPRRIRHVSIRALAWRATRRPNPTAWRPVKFQSAPSRGGRRPIWLVDLSLQMFQSAPSRGGRPSNAKGMVSTGSFNPRPRVEGDSGMGHD